MNHHRMLLTWLSFTSLMRAVSSGLDPGPNALQRLKNQMGNPCNCKAGMGRPPSAVSTIHTVNCGDKTAYLTPANNGKYACYPIRTQLTTMPGTRLPSCPSECQSTIHDLIQSSCYEAYQQCSQGNVTYFTAVLTRSTPIAVPYTHLQAPALCHSTVGRNVCWYVNAPLHLTNGGGPADSMKATNLQNKEI